MRLVQVDDGKVLAKTPMASQWFGEGATRLGDKLYQITWLSGAGFIYSVPDLKQVCCRCCYRRKGTNCMHLHCSCTAVIVCAVCCRAEAACCCWLCVSNWLYSRCSLHQAANAVIPNFKYTSLNTHNNHACPILHM
jgi:hypothetical protein